MKPRRRSAQSAAYLVDWTANLKELFRLAPSDCEPPRQVQVRRTTAGLTAVALSEPAERPPVKITVRLRMRADGSASIVSEAAKINLRLRGGEGVQ